MDSMLNFAHTRHDFIDGIITRYQLGYTTEEIAIYYEMDPRHVDDLIDCYNQVYN
tara:strand:+ start:2168 stop:2332 length:165 start_codon:yes stop_codon:yes gene_type:complete